MPEIRTVAIIGAGIMGHGIAEVAAMSGQDVMLVDVSQKFLSRASEEISASLTKLSEKGALRETSEKILGRIRFTTDIQEAVRDVDLVLEAVPEDIGLKSRVLSEADKLAPAHAIFASNTSGLSISVLSEATNRPDRFVGMHWMNPPVRMRLVELIKGDKTSEQAVGSILDLCKRYNKEPVIAKRDVWFFLSARSQTGWHLETALMVHGGRASVQDIDAMARYKLGLPMGPFEIADLTGAADIRVQGFESAKKILERRPSFEPWPAFLAALGYVVEQFWRPIRGKGLTGVKVGKGFYTYPAPGKYKRVDIPEDAADKVNPVEALAAVANTSAWCVTNGVGSIEDVERCFKLAYNWPKGVFEFVREYGASSIVKELRSKQKTAPEPIKAFYEPDPLLLKWS
jgi:enoyl-CoA hydratase/3-hydroxyacyl-CoA dehydrogenase